MNTTPLTATAVPTPAGPLAFVVSPEDAVVRGAGFESVDRTVDRLPAELRARGVRTLSLAQATADPAMADVVEAVQRYVAGDVHALDTIAAEQPGGPFFQAVWTAMRAIPAGQTASYAELAASAGRPAAVRAAGSACARNRLAPFVPCHRVLRTGGGLGGYLYGLGTKRALLAHEGAVVGHESPAAAPAPTPAPVVSATPAAVTTPAVSTPVLSAAPVASGSR
ncbi:methylated-DNA--[protein]-cysteine S-methyltransferase [Pengzhenrongella frigida]|uniref:methylated-DNA--[protein]-cysteine S-methyltransferase n=1 Tax=Pengzhenrongella frigida TaxID=1259133 RepID=A0A4Q5N0A2_9MICO|nr:methylated-DNA--[protein]-cysteine S-methyltransferase [Cellulomonas sp. HLT2-17]RYV51445.1 methylated-DNA--[protein]-cysteine S-methyltransferase [Cellulomonas sp. HLT2-17]